MVHLRTLLALVCVALLSGCAAPPQPRHAIFSTEQYAPFDHPGTGRLSGQAFMKTRGGDVKYAAGAEIYLNPLTEYSREHYERAIKGYERLEPADERMWKYRRVVTADAEGRFTFDNLPEGDYFVFGWVTWEYVSGYSHYAGATTSETGGIVYTNAHVRNGTVTQVVATR